MSKGKTCSNRIIIRLSTCRKSFVHPFGEVIHSSNIYFKALTGHNITKDLHCYSVCITKSSTHDTYSIEYVNCAYKMGREKGIMLAHLENDVPSKTCIIRSN